jgi:hypothetical protein
VYKYRNEDHIVDVCNGVEQIQLECTGGLDESKEALGLTGGLDSPREHWVELVAWIVQRSTRVDQWLG